MSSRMSDPDVDALLQELYDQKRAGLISAIDYLSMSVEVRAQRPQIPIDEQIAPSQPENLSVASPTLNAALSASEDGRAKDVAAPQDGG